MSDTLGPIAVLGAGTMGHGIAQCFAAVGASVRLYDLDLARAEKGRAQVKAVLDRVVSKGKMAAERAEAIVAAIAPHGDLAAAVGGARWIIEAAPEDMQLKVDLLGKAREAAPAEAMLGSNTSSLSITELGARLGVAERVVGLHFFNPPPVMELLEIVRGVSTSPATVEAAQTMAKAIGKTTILVNDAPGFATSRLGVILGAEAMRMLETGVASAEDIDRAMKLGYRHPMGPLELTDLVGLDVRLAILEHLTREIGDQFRPPAILRKLVRAGHLGKKVGRGFYVWTPEGPRSA